MELNSNDEWYDAFVNFYKSSGLTIDWINEHCLGKWKIGDRTDCYHIKFEKKEDCAYFMLVWS